MLACGGCAAATSQSFSLVREVVKSLDRCVQICGFVRPEKDTELRSKLGADAADPDRIAVSVDAAKEFVAA